MLYSTQEKGNKTIGKIARYYSSVGREHCSVDNPPIHISLGVSTTAFYTGRVSMVALSSRHIFTKLSSMTFNKESMSTASLPICELTINVCSGTISLGVRIEMLMLVFMNLLYVPLHHY